MFFKRIELFGFKSFAEKTRLDFEAGVTAIVGPNGCGKCVSGETKVLLADGRQEEIGHLVNQAIENSEKVTALDDGYYCYFTNPEQLKVFSLNPRTLKIEAKPILAFVKRKSPQFLLKVQTKSGRTVMTTHYHPFFSIRNGEVFSLKAEQLREKIKIALPRELKTSSFNNTLDIQAILESFKEDDSVYIQYSKELSNYIKTLANQTNGLENLAQEIGVSYNQIKSIGQGQALNTAIFSDLLNKQPISNLSEVIQEIKSRGTGVIKLPAELNQDLARFLGYIVSEGRNTASNQIWFVNDDEALINDFVSCAKGVFGIEAKIFSYRAKTKDTLIFSHALCKFLDRVFGIKVEESSRYKSVPKQLFAASDDVVSNFLSALFEGDGYICVDKQDQGKKNHVYIEYTTASQKLAEDIASLLLRFGVQSVIREKLKSATNTINKTKRKYYSLYIYGIDNVKRAAEHLNFIGKKARKLKLIRELDYIDNPNLDLIPEVNRLIKLLAREAKINVKKLRKISPKLAAYYENRCEVSRKGLNEVLCVIEEHGQINGLARLILNHLRSLAKSDIYWDEIVKIERVEAPEWVYDLTVEENHNFVANDIIVHNSNIADGIKWVLGEQSVRSMRGSKMEDVIFHGADQLSPIGFAEVSLTISNQGNLLPLDYEEVTITRRIFRSGESEYLINKIPVRLKDITELLMDTGLGMPSYSLMEQGNVDQILSSRPEERRAIFEEASGITKYKSKKEEALRKIERTSENLQRIGDIIVEVQRQIKSMERQVNKARRYKEEFERLKEYELKVAQYQYQNFKKEKEELESKVKAWEQEEQALAHMADTASNTLDKTRDELSIIEQEISQVQAQSYEVSATIKTQESEIYLNQERIEELSRRIGELKQQIENLEKKISHSAEDIKGTQTQLETIKEDKQDKLSFLEQKEEEINDILSFIQETEKKIAQTQAQEVEIIAQQAHKKSDLTKLETNLATFNARLRRLNVESQKSEEELENIGEKYRGCTEALESLDGEVKGLTREIWDLRSNLDIKLEKSKKLEFQLEDISHQITAIQSKLDFLKEIAKKYEGYSRGVKSILSAKDQGRLTIQGECFVVADKVSAQAQYQVAIEMALGENAQAIVVETQKAQEEAISYLKREDAGRVSFICLDSLPANAPRYSKPRGVLGEVSEFVQIEPKYQKVLQFLLANTFIAQDMDSARKIINDARDPNIKIVTLNGEILSRISTVAGSVSKDSDLSLLGRGERIVNTQAELEKRKQGKAEIENLKATRDKELEEISNLIGEKEQDFNKLKLNKAAKESEKANIETEKKRFEDELSVLKLETEETTEEVEKLEKDKDNLDQQLQRLQEKQRELQGIIQSHRNLIAEKGQQRQDALVEIAAALARVQALDREAEGARRRLQMVLETEAEQKQSKQTREQEFQDTTAKMEQLKQKIEQHKLQSTDLSQTKLALEEKLNQAFDKRKKLSTTIHDLEGYSREGQRKLNEVREKRANMQVKLTGVNYKQDSLTDRMQQGYQVDLPAILDGVAEIPPVEDFVLEEINRLKTRLEGMGPVNLIAIEENDQLQQRHSFLISQQEDLVNAQASLRKAITQINQTARKSFAETFQEIQVCFKEYFRLLFGGGDARLILLDENNILESGIEIVVRPPGKKLQNITLLSGGEKALTAISLLFAIFKVKPSPFCILDEVDASLDEANVGRFTNLLTEFIKTSQFIIITHNKRTINMADVMYGITMAMSGVSKIVSVKFSEQQQPPVREVAQVEG